MKLDTDPVPTLACTSTTSFRYRIPTPYSVTVNICTALKMEGSKLEQIRREGTTSQFDFKYGVYSFTAPRQDEQQGFFLSLSIVLFSDSLHSLSLQFSRPSSSVEMALQHLPFSK
jgi:hypothetical protein